MEKVELKKMVLRLSAGVGMDSAEFVLVPVTMTEDELSNDAWEAAVQHAQMYGLEPDSYRCYYEGEESDEDDDDRFSNDIEGYFEEYDPEEHDGLRIGGDDAWREYY